jgi:hypothetical protein
MIPKDDISRGHISDVKCDACGAQMPLQQQLFIDVERGPDYRSYMTAHGLSYQPCPRCRTLKVASGPFLWITRSAKPHLFFCTERANAPENGDNISMLAGYLEQVIGTLPDKWTSDLVQTIEFRFLPSLLKRCADPAPGSWIADIQWQLIVGAQLPTADMTALGRLCQRYPALLRASADKALGCMIDTAAERNDRDAWSRFEQTKTHLSILRAANGISI